MRRAPTLLPGAERGRVHPSAGPIPVEIPNAGAGREGVKQSRGPSLFPPIPPTPGRLPKPTALGPHSQKRASRAGGFREGPARASGARTRRRNLPGSHGPSGTRSWDRGNQGNYTLGQPGRGPELCLSMGLLPWIPSADGESDWEDSGRQSDINS